MAATQPTRDRPEDGPDPFLAHVKVQVKVRLGERMATRLAKMLDQRRYLFHYNVGRASVRFTVWKETLPVNGVDVTDLVHDAGFDIDEQPHAVVTVPARPEYLRRV